MPSWSSREELDHQVVTLARQGMGLRSIARSLGVARNTVRKILAGHAEALSKPHSALPAKPSRAPRDTKVTPWAPRVAELLRKYEDITAQRVFETLRDEGYEGGYTAIKDHVREVRPRPAVTPSLPTPTYGPGEMAEADWTPCSITLTGGGRVTVQIHGLVLCHSRRKVFRVHERCDLHALMDAHVATFERLGGVPAQCKYDNQKPVVLGYEGSRPVYNPRFLAFATHYGFRPVACRPMRPNDKPRVERSFLNGREFRDVDDLREQLARWHDKVCDPRVHKKLRRPVIELFAEEAPHLQPLPRHPYDTARVASPPRDLRRPRRRREGFLRRPRASGRAPVRLSGEADPAAARALRERRPRPRAAPRQGLRRLRAPRRRAHPRSARHAPHAGRVRHRRRRAPRRASPRARRDAGP